MMGKSFLLKLGSLSTALFIFTGLSADNLSLSNDNYSDAFGAIAAQITEYANPQIDTQIFLKPEPINNDLTPDFVVYILSSETCNARGMCRVLLVVGDETDPLKYRILDPNLVLMHPSVAMNGPEFILGTGELNDFRILTISQEVNTWKYSEELNTYINYPNQKKE